MEAAIVAEVERVVEEERQVEVERWVEAECHWRAEEAKRQQVLEECCQQVEVEQRGSNVEITAGPSKKRKIQETVSDKLSEQKSTHTTIGRDGENGGFKQPALQAMWGHW